MDASKLNMCILHVNCTMVSRVRVSAMHRDRYAVRLGPLAIIRRQRCHRTLRDHAKAERTSRNCRVGARRPNLPAHRQQGHPIDGNRSGRGQPWIMDARCHAMHAGTRQGAFRSCTACIRSPNQEATAAAPTNTTHVLVMDRVQFSHFGPGRAAGY